VPDLLVGGEAVLQAKPDEGHLPAREEPFLTGKVACRRASAALQACLERRQVQAVGLEERAVRAGGEIERPVRQLVDGPATEKPTEITKAGLRERRTFRTHRVLRYCNIVETSESIE
jgi:hypothetical protein